MSTATYNVSHASITVLSVPVKMAVISVPQDSSYKKASVSRDAILETSFQEPSVRSAKMDVLTVKSRVPVSSAKLADTHTTEYVTLTVQLVQFLNRPI